jgi:RimJ/RimL family protein N-acetyltransferase
LTYILMPSAWRKGYETEVGIALKQYTIETMRLNPLIALIEPENAASERVAVKLGMHLEKEIICLGGA